MRQILTAIVIGAALLLAVSGCDSVTPDEEAGTFSVSVTGDVQLTASGQAVFGHGTDPETGQEGFGIFLIPAGGAAAEGTQFVFLRLSDRPGTGTYQFVDIDPEEGEEAWPAQQFGGYAILNVGAAGGTVFWSTAGTLQITRSDANRVAGSFQQTARGIVPDQEENGVQEFEISLSGEFNAVGTGLVGFGQDIRSP